jgi:hypothetical protein
MIGATLLGAFSTATLAGPRSPSVSPPPATVVMIPLVLTRRMRLLPVSAIRNEPSGRAATSRGALSVAPVAASPSPPKPALPFPATVVITPAGLTRRTRLLPVSAMRKPPSAVGETPRGPFSRTVGFVAASESPANPPGAFPGPAPATVLMVPASLTRRIRLLAVSAIRYVAVPPTKATSDGVASCAPVAPPPSPVNPAVPVPATVSMRATVCATARLAATSASRQATRVMGRSGRID